MVPFPPLGGVNATLTEVELTTVDIKLVGGDGIVVTEDDADDAVDVPPELVAVTVNV